VQDTLGWIYYGKVLYQMALAPLKIAISVNATPLRKCHLGLAYVKVGDGSQGQRLLQSALQAEPELAKAEMDW
jgi:hypothetical protein